MTEQKYGYCNCLNMNARNEFTSGFSRVRVDAGRRCFLCAHLALTCEPTRKRKESNRTRNFEDRSGTFVTPWHGRKAPPKYRIKDYRHGIFKDMGRRKLRAILDCHVNGKWTEEIIMERYSIGFNDLQTLYKDCLL